VRFCGCRSAGQILRPNDLSEVTGCEPQVTEWHQGVRRSGTDRDGLLDLKQEDLQISVSPELLLRAIKAYDAVLRLATERGWPFISEGVGPRVLICGEPLQLAVTGRTEPMLEVKVRPGERRPRSPTGSLAVSLTAGYRKVMASDKREAQVESKLLDLLIGAETFAAEVHAEHERDAAVRRREEIESHRRHELERQIKRLRRNAALWRRAQRIRAYIQAVAARLKTEVSIPPESDAAKWPAWARRYADSIDPTCQPITIAAQEFWD
jgi:hypothetical protein